MKSRIPYSIIATLMLGTFFSPQQVVLASTSKNGWNRAPIVLDGKTVSIVPFQVAKDIYSHRDTVFVPIWYLMHLLGHQGIKSTWNGRTHTLSLTTPDGWNANVKQPASSGSRLEVILNGIAVQDMPEAVWDDPSTNRPTTFVPLWYFMQVLKRLGFESNWDGSHFILKAPAYADPTKTLIQVDPTVQQGGSITVHVVPVDFSGDKLGKGENIKISDGTTPMVASWNAQKNDYEATFTEERSGQVTFTATMNGIGVHEIAVTNVQQVANGSDSEVLLPASVIVGTNNVLVSIIPKDNLGTSLGSGHAVTVSDGNHTVQANWNHAKSMYEAVFSETSPGIVHFEVQVDGSPLNVGHPLTTYVNLYHAPRVLSQANSSVSAPNTAYTGQTITVAVQPRDQYGNVLAQTENVVVTESGSSKSFSAAWNPTNQDYEATLTLSVPGDLTFSASVNGVNLTQTAVTHVQAVSPTLSQVSAPGSVTAGTNNVLVSVVPMDTTGAPMGAGQKVTVSDGTQTLSTTWNTTTSAYEATFSETTSATVSFTVKVDGTTLSSTPSTVVNPSVFSLAHSTITAPTYAEVGQPITIAVDPKDQYGNILPNQTATVTDSVYSGSSTAVWNSSQNTYESTFTEWNPGSVSFNASVDSQSLTSQPPTAVEIPSIIASVPHEVNGTATVTNSVYEVTLESVDSQGNPMPLTGDVLLDLQDLSSTLGNSTPVISGFSQSSGGPYTGTVVSLSSGQTSVNIYAQFNFSGGSGTIHSTDLSLKSTQEDPTVSGYATYSSSQQTLTINFDESMNPTTLTTQNIGTNISYSSGVLHSTKIVWSNNNKTVEAFGVTFDAVGSAKISNMYSQFGRPLSQTVFTQYQP